MKDFTLIHSLLAPRCCIVRTSWGLPLASRILASELDQACGWALLAALFLTALFLAPAHPSG